MSSTLSKPIAAIERVLRIGPDLSVEDTLRARVIYCTALSYVALQIVNILTLIISHQGMIPKRPLIFASCVLFLVAMALLRYTKSKHFYGVYFGTMVVGVLYLAATRGPEAVASFATAGGIHTPAVPALCFGTVLVTLIGSRTTTCLYLIATAILTVFLARLSAAAVTDPQILMVGKVRAVQLGIFIPALCLIILTISQLAFSALNKLEAALERAKRAEDTRKELLATMSHEIRTPLNGIIAVSDLLAKHKHDETTNTHLNIISLSASNLLDIVNESLGRARSEHLGDVHAKDISVRSEPFSPKDILQQTCDLFTAHAGQKGLWIGTHELDDLPDTLLGDGPHLRQVMSNLVGNAIKFTHSGGVRLGARCLDKTDASVSLQFFVQDTGVGIENDALQNVFERFGQSASAQTTDVNGTGLGLAISNDLVTAMGGKLDVQSTLGSGSTFYFTLTLPYENPQSDTALTSGDSLVFA